MTIKRQSTTAKVTIAQSRSIARDCDNGDGVIVRYRKQELGVVGVETIGGKVFFRVRETSALLPREACTIRKSTIPHLGRGVKLVLNVGTTTTRSDRITEFPLDHVQRVIDANVNWCESPIHDANCGSWQGIPETTVVTRGYTYSRSVDSDLRLLCRILGQDCIAYTLGGIGHLAFHRDYVGERYEFDPSQFTR